MNKEKLLEQGSLYLQKGYSIIPLKYKKPCIEWKKYQEEKATLSDLKNWVDTLEMTGVGIVTGKISNLVVIDVDSEEDVMKLPETPTVKTARGKHHYFNYPERTIQSRTGIMPHVDIQSDGKYVVAPPSIHETGHEYRWIIGLEEKELAEIPTTPIEFIDKDLIGKEKLLLGTGEGARNITATELLGKFLHYIPQKDWDLVFHLTRVWNSQNRPPLEDKELKEIFMSIAKRETNKNKEAVPLLQIVKLSELMSKELGENPFLIEKLLPLNGLNVLSGSPGVGKSWIILEMARAVASGQDFLGKYKTIQGGVLIIDGESGEMEMQRRTKSMNFDPELPIGFIQLQGVKVDNPKTIESLLTEAKNQDVKLMIFDPFSAMHSKQENSAEEMQKVMEGFESLTKEGITVLFVHHHRKGNGLTGPTQTENMRGSTVIGSRVDSQSFIKKEAEIDAYIELKYSTEKLRNGKKEKTFTLYIDNDESGISLRYGGENIEEELKRDQAHDLILENLTSGSKSRDELLDILKKNEIGARTGSDIIRKMSMGKLIKTEKSGKKNIYSLNDKSATEQ